MATKRYEVHFTDPDGDPERITRVKGEPITLRDARAIKHVLESYGVKGIRNVTILQQIDPPQESGA